MRQVFAQQASLAGIKVNVDLTTPGVEFGPNYAKFLFAQDYVIYTTYLTQIALSGLPSSPLPGDAFQRPALHRTCSIRRSPPSIPPAL